MKLQLERLLAVSEVRPARLFLTVLSLIFGVEATVMVAMPQLFPNDQEKLYYAIFDACFLTGVLAPLLWWLVIVPLRTLAATRLRLLDRILEAQEEERGRIARELHDSIGQLMTCLQVGLRAAEESISDVVLQQRLQELRNVGAESHREIRRISSGLRPTVLDDVGLQAALERHCDDLHRMSGIEADLCASGLTQQRLPQAMETACYRIVQEATTNAIRHGQATRLSIELQIENDVLHLSVRDNGCGFDLQQVLEQRGPQNSVGLWSIEERAELLHGSVSIESTLGVGTTIFVQFPIPSDESAS